MSEYETEQRSNMLRNIYVEIYFFAKLRYVVYNANRFADTAGAPKKQQQPTVIWTT